MVATTAEASQRTLEALRESRALLDGHFLLSSGRHAGRYVQCALLLQHPVLAEQVCRDLAGRIRAASGDDRPFDVVIGPAMGAVVFAYELARALGCRGVFAEREPEGGFVLRRGFHLGAGERVLVAEDVVTTGGSAKEVLRTVVAGSEPTRVAVASLVNRSGTDNPFEGHEYYRLLDLEVPSWEPAECPLCQDPRQGTAVKPGSRPDPS